MEKLNLPILVQCPEHLCEVIQRVDLDPLATKDLFCIECMLHNKDQKSLSPSLHNLSYLFNAAAEFYSKRKQEVDLNPSPLLEYTNLLSKQLEYLSQLDNHIAQEKKKVNIAFNEITKNVLEIIEKERVKHLDILDKQFQNFRDHYSFFEAQVKKGYPTPEEAKIRFPSQEELKMKFLDITRFSQLSDFVKQFKEDKDHHGLGVDLYRQGYLNKQEYFDGLMKKLDELVIARPTLFKENFETDKFRDKLKEELTNNINSAFTLQEPISEDALISDQQQSKILKLDDFNIVKKWLHKKDRLILRLLYRGSRDGMTPQAFHLRCDERGPTITFIKCHFVGASSTSIIGGYLDKDWHNQGKCIASKKAFIFSINSKEKCKVADPYYAAYGGDYLPIFGEWYDICISTDLRQSFIFPKSYTNAGSLIDPEVNKGPNNTYYFMPLEIEVYGVK